MAQVSVTINGRQYRMACDDGQEHHLARLAHDLDQRIAHLRTTFGEIGDMRLTVMAALIVADELSEARRRMLRADQELAVLKQAAAAAAGAPDRAAELAAMVNSAAERVEKAARLIGQTDDGPHTALG